MQFNVILQYHDELLRGLWLTIQLSLALIVLGTVLGIAAASIRQTAGRAVRMAIDTYAEVVRNTPFLIQLFVIFFGLPAMGLRIGATSAALIAMTINLGAYSTEIVRAGIESIHRSQIEAGEALGLTRLRVYRHVVLLPAIAKVWPSQCSQFILMMLASSVTSAISTQDLAAAAALIELQTFRSLEVYDETQQYRYVVLPQAVRISLPPSVGFLVQLVENTSITSIIGFVELARAGQLINNATFQPGPVFLTVAALYLVICWPLSRLSRHFERKLHVASAR